MTVNVKKTSHIEEPIVKSGNETKQILKSPKSISLDIASTPRSHKYCVVCKHDGNRRNSLSSIPQTASTQAFIQTGVFVFPQSRCCRRHVESGYFNNEALGIISSTHRHHSYFSKGDVCRLLDDIRHMMTNGYSQLNFDNPFFLSNDEYVTLTGFNKDQFHEITESLTSLKNSAVRSIRTSVATFLLKLRTGLSNKMISVLIGLQEPQIQRIIYSVRTAFMTDFVPGNLGFEHISREDFCKNHTSQVASSLFSTCPDDAIIVLDGTYIYIQKSSDYDFQRRSYSTHKNRSLLKPMVIVGTDGYILDVIGPYFADSSNNDASITKHFLRHSHLARSWFKENDVFIVDRGFRDAVDFLEEAGFQVKMPCYLPKGSKQHSTEEANMSRLITKVRWVVESVNGRIKQLRMLNKVIPNTLIPSIGDFVRIICALCNRFRSTFSPTENSDTLDQLTLTMLQKSKEPNRLLQYLQENELLNKRTVYTELKDCDHILHNFPKLSLDDLRNITLGVYQLKQAASYTKEHLTDCGLYELFVHKEQSNILKVKIQSRHVRSTIHTLWLQFDSSNKQEPIQGWYCTCKAGARVVGCCSHIASVIWYLGYERYQPCPTTKVSISRETLSDARMVDSDMEFLEE